MLCHLLFFANAGRLFALIPLHVPAPALIEYAPRSRSHGDQRRVTGKLLSPAARTASESRIRAITFTELGNLVQPQSAPDATDTPLPRRRVVSVAAAALVALLGHQASAAYPAGFEPPRVQGIGGGFDMLANDTPVAGDVLYPPSLNGTWICERRVASVEGDAGQAQGAWKLLGGTGDFQRPESYSVRFIDLRRASDAITGLDGQRYYGDVFDRGFEIASRAGATVRWDARAPNVLSYERSSGGPGAAAELKVVQRSVELPSEKGWGSNELIRVTTTSGAFGASFNITYATRVQRRWRRALTDAGDRVVEGLEIMKTYRVLDGVAGIELPTSTVKSTIRLTRPRI